MRLLQVCFVIIIGMVCFLTAGCIDASAQEKRFKTARAKYYRNMVSDFDNRKQSPVIAGLDYIKGDLSLAECIDIALKDNKDVQIARFRCQQASGNITSALSTALPKVTISAQALKKNDSFAMGPSEITEYYNAGIRVLQPLYLGGLVGVALDAANVFSFQTSQELRLATQGVHSKVRMAYLDVLLAQEMLKVEQQMVLSAKELLKDSQAKLKYGTGRQYDVLGSQVNLKASLALEVTAVNRLALAKTSLMNILGVCQLSVINLSEKFVYDDIEVDQWKALELSMTQRPDILIAVADCRLAEDNLATQKASNKPNVYLQGDYYRNRGSFNNTSEYNSSAGIIMEWSIFDGHATKGNIIMAKASLRQSQLILEKIQEQAQLELNQALLNIESAREYVQTQSGNIATASEALRLAKISYRQGAGILLDVTTSETALASAQADYYQSVYNHQLAKLSLESATGIVGETPLPIVIDKTENKDNTEIEEGIKK